MNWKDELKEMKYRDLERKFPDAYVASGSRSMKLKPYCDKTANGLTRCLLDWINFSGGVANRINCQGQVRKDRVQLAFGNSRELVSFTPSTTRKGTADIIAVKNGRHVSIEVKIGRDRMSEAQLQEQAKITAAGGLYLVCRNMGSFVIWWKQNFN